MKSGLVALSKRPEVRRLISTSIRRLSKQELSEIMIAAVRGFHPEPAYCVKPAKPNRGFGVSRTRILVDPEHRFRPQGRGCSAGESLIAQQRSIMTFTVSIPFSRSGVNTFNWTVLSRVQPTLSSIVTPPGPPRGYICGLVLCARPGEHGDQEPECRSA